MNVTTLRMGWELPLLYLTLINKSLKLYSHIILG